MFKISLAIKKDDRFIIRKDYFNQDYFYGFFEICTVDTIEISYACDYVKSNFPAFHDVKLYDISYITTVENPETVYIFCLAHIHTDFVSLKDEYVEVTEKELRMLNMIYPDAFCRDALLKEEKTLSMREKEILIAADKIFNITDNAARADAFIALMENRIDESSFEKFIKERKRIYSYGMPDFGFTSDMNLCIWKNNK